MRRYGFDSELFSFECGRRCPTGPGIYAFRSSQAEQIFSVLQETIQMSTNSNRDPSNLAEAPSSNSRAFTPTNNLTLTLNNHHISSQYVNVPQTPPSDTEPINYTILDLDDERPGHIVTTAPVTPISKTPKAHNWTPPGTPTSCTLYPQQPYATIDFDKTVALSSAANHRIIES